MAEEQVQELEQAPPEPPKKKSFFKLLIIVLVVLGVGGGAGYYFYGRTAIAQYLKHQKAEQAKMAKAELGPLLALDPFIINVAGSPGKFVKIQIALEVKDVKIQEHAKKLNPVMRDAMLTVLGAKAPEVFMDISARPAMKKELLAVVNPLFKDGDVKAVYITDIIMQ
jgi:flagellar FliL protein